MAVVADTGHHRLVLFRVDDGIVLRTLGTRGAGAGQLDWPSAVLSSRIPGEPDACLLVGDAANRRIQILRRTGEVVRSVSAANGVTPLSRWLASVAVCVDTDRLLVADTENHRVVSWCLSSGDNCKVLTGQAGQGTGPGQWSKPVGLITTANGAVWVADMDNHRICLLR